jgi:Tfp pilus assembly protein PilZ
MRLVTFAFPSAASFLSSYDDGVLTVATRTDAVLGEQILVEISFPGLPNRALMRAVVDGLLIDEEGLRVRISDEDLSTREFMLKIARGELKMSVHREHKRFPASLGVRYIVEGSDAEQRGVVDDLGAGGTFVLTDTPPVAGAKVRLTIDVPDDKEVNLSGMIAWVKTAPSANAGFGVDFDPPVGDDGRRLRNLLRRASETGEVDLDKRDKER